MAAITAALVLVAAGLLVRIAVIDFRSFRISNADVIVLCAVALALIAVAPGAGVPSDLAAGALLFGLGVLFWLLRMMGAGDAKLYLPIGFLVGWNGMALFAILLLPASLLLMLVVRLGPALLPASGFVERLRHIAARRTYPYGVPMALAALVAMLTTRL